MKYFYRLVAIIDKGQFSRSAIAISALISLFSARNVGISFKLALSSLEEFPGGSVTGSGKMTANVLPLSNSLSTPIPHRLYVSCLPVQMV
ncbi:hypothetical protein KR505_04325 [Eubacterium callanderi]|uniref:hypothetical protein n=1 Tax=Eubacterium TaxID=1730 RepID=UPI0012B376E9|nr:MULTISPECIES: hypothetical protein [Eubacterium]MBV1682618.1 hypothetical protein [Eubacterium callanderi]MSS93119.1 hypothetical protein [Eubacterium sp. BL-380-WT-2B]